MQATKAIIRCTMKSAIWHNLRSDRVDRDIS